MLIDTLQILYPSVPLAELNLVVDEVYEDFIDYTNTRYVPDTATTLLVAMAKERVNTMGAEGFSTESVAGSSVALWGDYSAGIYKRLNKYKHIRTPKSRERVYEYEIEGE